MDAQRLLETQLMMAYEGNTAGNVLHKYIL